MIMAALAASAPPWIPEDDLLLKNAIEAGASLEALAKGAVRFSRKFTVRELRDRWHSLLYDPTVSAEASARMIECDLAVSNHKVSPEVSVKRKLDSVRRLYYAMRKKTRKRTGNFPRFSLLGGPSIDDIPIHSPMQGGNSLFGDHNQTEFGLVGKKCYSKLRVEVPSLTVEDEAVALSHPLPENSNLFRSEEVPSSLELWKTIEDITAPAMPMCVSNENGSQEEALVRHDDVGLNGNKVSLSDMNLVSLGAVLDQKESTDVLNNSTVISESDYVDLSESLLNFTNEDELLIDAKGEDQIDRSGNEDISTSYLNEVDSKTLKPLIPDQSLVIHDCKDHGEATIEGSHHDDIEQCDNFGTESSTVSSVTTANMKPFDGDMECTLNSEDPEIPCNDDVLFPKKFSCIIGSASKKTGYRPYLYANLMDQKQEKSLLREGEKPAPPFVASHVTGTELLPATIPGQQLVGCGGKSESSDNIAFIQASHAHRDGKQSGTALATLTSAAVGMPKMETLCTSNALDLPLCASSVKQVTSVSEADPVMMDEEESESDEDMPSYADIEALILGMDLCPDDTDSYSNREVLRYQNDDTRRSIMRLEQCAQSSVRRSIASRGALAVLYGRNLKHFIRETEVVLGRATEDMEIDIDLGREGPANKISRRQAIIKMEEDGSFLLRNLGKSLVFLNGQEVATGQIMILGSGSLIEVVLGRATEDMEIDIDLGREGPANKISRRQAIIKMEEDGSFLLRNLGKSLVFLNGQEVATGQIMILGSGSLIEIGEMAFMFEINPKAVSQHLQKATKNRLENNKFEWSEGVP